MKAIYADRGIRMVAEFHEAFHCHHAEQPWLPELSKADQNCLSSVASELAKIAARLKAQAAEANDLGRAGLGLLLVRLQLMIEETGEVADALADRDLGQVLHELSDLSYVVDGTYLTCGLGHVKLAADEELHSANMSKLGEDGQPIIHSSGRVVKGPNYRKPQMLQVLKDIYQDVET